MEMHIEKPIKIDKPEFPKFPYDYRNMEKAGHFKGVGERGKTGDMGSSMDCYAMPKDSKVIAVPRDHDG